MIRDIYSSEGLQQLDDELRPSLHGDLIHQSILLEQFLTTIFPIDQELKEFQEQAKLWDALSEFKRQFVQRRALRKYSREDVMIRHHEECAARRGDPHDIEIGLDCRVANAPRNDDLDASSFKFEKQNLSKLATQVLEWLKNEDQYKEELDEAMRYVAYKVYNDPDHSVYILPKKLDFEKLVDINDSYRRKEGFSEAHYCIYCHNQERDYCRTGMISSSSSGLTRGSLVLSVMDPRVKPEDDGLEEDDIIKYTRNSLGNILSGCPLGQKISEMNYLYSKGNILAALAVTMIDNPLVAATGSRVCNDCMKSCIYQKQEPVDIPCIESDMLAAVLRLPYGAEIYYLLTRWNPLANYIAKENAPGKALVAGMGPAGFAMSYYLLREGHKVVGVDAMEISKLDEGFFRPIKNWKEIVGTYKPQGFGGVSEYGITDRWDKSNLLLIRMILQRFANFELRDKTKLGKDISLQSAAENHDYIALCLGAGTPIFPHVKNIDAKGIFSAFDFLMERNLKPTSSSALVSSTRVKDPRTHNNVFVGSRVKPENDALIKNDPVIILGAGLTAIDCALESIKESADVTILYRKSMREAPSYRENHEELQIALNKGIKFIENTNLETIEIDELGHIKSVNGDIPARTLIFAFGTGYNDQILLDEPDVAVAYKDRIGIFGDLDPKYIGSVVKAIASSKDGYDAVSVMLRRG